jgi:hypothetical protein
MRKSRTTTIVMALMIIISNYCLSGCSSRKGFPQSTEQRKKNAAIVNKKKSENKKRFQFLTRDKIQYKRFQPNVPF